MEEKTINVEAIDDEQLLDELGKFVVSMETQRAAAQALNVSYQSINDMLHRRSPVSESVAAELGWKQTPRMWVRAKPTDEG